ncbi:protein Lines homolog 1-like [Physella acuta]|uniref:protein Lines homolog 1-like n=1 Tax=Physella acuta TaxID=109671 RepID=UPI0027DCE63F|nr:protein Lines homolog 1-like [Physella acuta]XP_059175401.1 protein Lines homolog 1-like [Physella acuta]
MDKWYQEVALLQSSKSNAIDFLIPCLSKGDMFTQFLSKKTMLSGIKMGYLQVDDVLELFIQTEDLKSSPILIELLEDLMSPQLFQDRKINTQTFEWIKENNFLQEFFLIRINIDTTFLNSSGIIEYLTLIQRCIKHCLKNNELDFQDLESLCVLVENLFVKNFITFFKLPSSCKGHLICKKYLQVLSSLLNARFLFDDLSIPTCIINFSHTVSKIILSDLCQVQNSQIFFLNSNFVSSNVLNSNSKYATSVLVRSTVFVILKTCALMEICNDEVLIKILTVLFNLWSQTQGIIATQRQPHTREWLSTIFADQDDKWVTSLLCLLKLHKKINREQNPGMNCESKKDSGKLNELVDFINPHRLFLQFIFFIKYDHLVLVDFMSSPETTFLLYFTLYLHVLITEWSHFEKVCMENDTFTKNSDSFRCSHDQSLNKSFTTCMFHAESNSLLHSGPHSKNMPDASGCEIKNKAAGSVFLDSKNQTTIGSVIAPNLVPYSDSDNSDEEDDPHQNNPSVANSSLYSLDETAYLSPCGKENVCSTTMQNNTTVLVMEMLIRLRINLEKLDEKSLFPYNVKPLIKLLEKCEDVYDRSVCVDMT